MREDGRYDYVRQCWIVNGKVAVCGHSDKQTGCYACFHEGETISEVNEVKHFPFDLSYDDAFDAADAWLQQFRVRGWKTRIVSFDAGYLAEAELV